MIEHYKLPPNWEVVPFERIAADTKYPIGDGDHGSIKPSCYGTKGIPYIRVADLVDGDISKAEMVFIPHEVHRANPKSHLYPGDILISKTGATIGKVAIISDNIPEANTTASVGKITVNKQIAFTRFVYWYMTTTLFQSQMWRVSIKSAQPGFNIENMKKFLIPLPPLPEQKRIAAIMDKADAIRRKRQQAIKLAADFLYATFLDMFGDPVTNPKGWKSSTIGELIKVKSGNFLPANKMREGEIPVYGGNGINGFHDAYMFDSPVLVIGRVGVYCGVIHKTEPKSWVTDNALYVAERSEDVTDLYLEWALRMANLNQYASQAGQPLISGGRIYPVEINVPPLNLQRQFENIQISYFKMRKILLASSGEGNELFDSITQRAFRGEL